MELTIPLQEETFMRTRRVPTHSNVPPDDCISHCSPAQRPQGTSVFAATRHDKTRRCVLLLNYFGQLSLSSLLLLFVRWPVTYWRLQKQRYKHYIVSVLISLNFLYKIGIRVEEKWGPMPAFLIFNRIVWVTETSKTFDLGILKSEQFWRRNEF